MDRCGNINAILLTACIAHKNHTQRVRVKRTPDLSGHFILQYAEFRTNARAHQRATREPANFWAASFRRSFVRRCCRRRRRRRAHHVFQSLCRPPFGPICAPPGKSAAAHTLSHAHGRKQTFAHTRTRACVCVYRKFAFVHSAVFFTLGSRC